MILTRRIPPSLILMMGGRIAVIAGAWAATIYVLFEYAGFEFLRVPFLPIATVGTAVAFYVGFKNNSAYERFWEGRKIWGGVVNTSRTWATQVQSYIAPGDDSAPARDLRRRLVYRQLAWINALRLQLRKTTRFSDNPARPTKRRLERHAEIMRNDWDKEIGPFLEEGEHAEMKQMRNPATHMLTRQGAELAALVNARKLDLFHQIAMMEQVTELYTLQGKCERIKNTPFPRQYAEYSRVFTWVFVFLVPFGLLDVFADVKQVSFLSPIAVILASVLVSWVFATMEGIGDASEDPFERSMNDVPMNALCRTIETDLRQMLGETELPPKEQAVDHVLY